MTGGDHHVVPVASYRFQLDADVDLEAVRQLLTLLAELGVSHVYLSPVAEALPGSTHGYDVVDPTRVRAELGGEAALLGVFDDAAALGLAVVIDHVPNHVSVARPDLQQHWWRTLRDGPESPSARWFDIDWEAGDGRMVLPVLDRPIADLIDAGVIRIERNAGTAHLVLGSGQMLPLTPGSEHLAPAETLDQQRYRLVEWRSPIRNVRRFFTVDDLVAVRVEHAEVAAEVDALTTRWAAHAGFGGLRVDHVDGLADPGSYLADLRARIGTERWLLVEKILAPGEQLPPSWAVDGTTGYEFMRLVDHLLVDPSAETLFDRLWAEVAPVPGTFGEVEDQARREVLRGGLRPDAERVVRAMARALGLEDAPVAPGAMTVPTADEVEQVITELTVRLPRYRTYLPDDPAGLEVLDTTVESVASERPQLAWVCRQVAQLLRAPAGDAAVEARTRWQQLTGPAMAKGAEDRAFYRYLRLASLCEVGGDPGTFGGSVEEFHAHNAWVQQHRPRTMLAGSTHDTKRSEDVRARSAALTWRASDWAYQMRRWLPAVVGLGLDAATASLAVQTVVTCPGLDPDRLGAALVKSAREADLVTSWTDPDEAVEATMRLAADALVGEGPLAREIAAWASLLDRDGLDLSLVALVLRLTAPGVPDLYQGSERLLHRLVDPDNRSAPDWSTFGESVRAAASPDLRSAVDTRPDLAKAVVVRRVLAVRRRHLTAFGESGSYRPLSLHGPQADRWVGFVRGDSVATASRLAPSRANGVGEAAGTTEVELPPGHWRSVLCDAGPIVEGRVDANDLASGLPVAVLERVG